MAIKQCLLLMFCIGSVHMDVLVYTQKPLHQIVEEFRCMPAHFGDTLPSNGLRGFAVHSYPADGCSPIRKPPNVTENFTGKWIVLIARYNCSFEEKVRNAQNANYDAVIVYNINSSDLEPMSAKNPIGIRIPSVFVGEETGRIIIYNYEYDENYFLIINSDLPFNINTHLLLPFAIVVGLCFLIMVAFMVVKCVRERRRLRRHRLPSSALKRIPTSKFTKGDAYETCAICLDDYIEGEKLRILPCSHAYHCKCIDPWLTKNRRVCPVCKRKVFGRNETRTRSGSSSESEADDTTPLLNPVANNHGTFTEAIPNIFRRSASESALPTFAADLGESSYNRNNGEGDQINNANRLVNVTSDGSRPIEDNMSFQSYEGDKDSHSSNPILHSNNVMNPYLSGSFADSDGFIMQEQNLNNVSNAQSHHSLNSGRVNVVALPNENFTNPRDNDNFIL